MALISCMMSMEPPHGGGDAMRPRLGDHGSLVQHIEFPWGMTWVEPGGLFREPVTTSTARSLLRQGLALPFTSICFLRTVWRTASALEALLRLMISRASA